MKVILYDRFGEPDVLQVRDVPAPRTRRGRARVRVRAAALNPKDVLLRKGKMRWLSGGRLPRTPGYDLAGELLDDARDLPAGTEVFGMIQHHRGGACAEIAQLPFDELAAKPASLTMEEASSLPLAGLTALQGLRDELQVEPGQTALLNGASGGVGTLAVQIAKALGLYVIAVCSGRNAELVTSLGADRVLDYTTQDLHAERGLDAVFDIFGNLPWPIAKGMLTPTGRYCTTVPRSGSAVRGALRRLGASRAALVVVQSRRADLEQMAAWVESGQLRPVVDKVVAMEDSAEGHAHLETRRARGKVVVQIQS